MRKCPAGFIPLCQVTKLHRKPTGLDGIETAIVTLNVVIVLLGLAMVSNQLHALGHGLVIRCDRAPLAARSQVLSGVEAERRSFAHGTGALPDIVFLREVFCAMCLAG